MSAARPRRALGIDRPAATRDSGLLSAGEGDASVSCRTGRQRPLRFMARGLEGETSDVVDLFRAIVVFRIIGLHDDLRRDILARLRDILARLNERDLDLSPAGRILTRFQGIAQNQSRKEKSLASSSVTGPPLTSSTSASISKPTSYSRVCTEKA